MEKRFTKGNWGFDENYISNNGTHVIYSTNSSYTTQKTYIATTMRPFNSEADAKLMAAAPELLIELKKSTDLMEDLYLRLGNEMKAIHSFHLSAKIEHNKYLIKKATE